MSPRRLFSFSKSSILLWIILLTTCLNVVFLSTIFETKVRLDEYEEKMKMRINMMNSKNDNLIFVEKDFVEFTNSTSNDDETRVYHASPDNHEQEGDEDDDDDHGHGPWNRNIHVNSSWKQSESNVMAMADQRSYHNRSHPTINITMDKKHRPYPFPKTPFKCTNDTRLNTIMNQYWNQSMVRYVVIRGERHTGTKLARTLIDRNTFLPRIEPRSLNDPILVDGIYGWKHGFLHSNFSLHSGDVMLLIARDPFSWALSMFKEPYNMIFPSDNMTHFGPFLMGYYQTQNCEASHSLKKCTFPMEQAQNIIQLRTAKYKNWTNALQNQPYSLINYERLAVDQVGTMTKFFDNHNILHVGDKSFQDALGYISHQGEREESYTPSVSRENYLDQYTLEEIRFVLDNLDLDFERLVLHYTYDDVEKYIEGRFHGNNTYGGPPKLTPRQMGARKRLATSHKLGLLRLIEYDC